MLAMLEVELFGEDTRQLYGIYSSILDGAVPGLGKQAIGYMKPSSWVAEITGPDLKYKYARTFLKCKKEYSRSNSKGSRGVFAEYLLESGKVYEVKSQISWKNSDRYFCTVDNDGNIIHLSEDKIKSMLSGGDTTDA